MRRGKLLGLKWPDIEFNRNKLSVLNNIVKTNDDTAIEKSPKSEDGIRPIIVLEDVIDLLKDIRNKQLERNNMPKFVYNNYMFCMDEGTKLFRFEINGRETQKTRLSAGFLKWA